MADKRASDAKERRKPSKADKVEKGEKKKPPTTRERTKPKESFTKKDTNDAALMEEIAGEKKPDRDKDVSTIATATDNRGKWAINMMAKPIRKLSREFIDNKKIKPSDYTTEFYEKNDTKNRYNDILCIDQTRVVLKERGPDEDYIHASWINLPDGQRYICTQGPIADTLEDFWHMLYTEKSNVIVMLCALNEGKHEKCARYYPKTKDKIEEFGMYKVTIKEQKPDPFELVKYTILNVETSSGGSMLVHHFGYPSWPDHTAPDRPTAMVGIYKMGRKLTAGAPVTVHCSAGIGRTATFVGIDYANQRIQGNCDFLMVDLLRELRKQRFHAVQSPMQYIFLHVCILELFADDNVIAREGKYKEYIDSYSAMLKRYASRMTKQMEEKDGGGGKE